MRESISCSISARAVVYEKERRVRGEGMGTWLVVKGKKRGKGGVGSSLPIPVTN
jgi:hypothetical protein